MAITSARMQMRRGNEIDFDPDKMHPGEWAVSTDKKIVRMCIYPGLCLRMATYEAFEEDMKQIQSIVSEARTIQEAINRINTEVSSNAQAVAEYTVQAKQYRDEAKQFRDEASALANVGIATETVPGLMAGGDNAISEDGKLLLTKTTTDRTLLKSHAGGLKVNRVDGESQQAQYSGKNLYETTTTGLTSYGINVSVESDGKVVLNGAATADVSVSVGKVYNLKANSKYIFSGLSKSTASIYMNNIGGISGWTVPSSNGFTPLTDVFTSGVWLYVKNGTTLTNESFYPMIRLADIEDNTYEPYVGGVPSPNPDYPQEINSVVLSEIKGVGKNLASLNDIGGSNVNVIVNNDAFTITSTSLATYSYGTIKNVFLKSGKYTFSYIRTIINGSPTDNGLTIYKVVNESDVYLGRINANNKGTFTFEEDCVIKMYVYLSSGTALAQTTSINAQIQIEAGSTATDYAPYTESKITLSNPITLRGIGDVKDVLCKRDGVYGVLRKIGLFDAYDESWTLQTTNFPNGIANFSKAIRHTTNKVMCNRFSIQYTLFADTKTEGWFSNGLFIFIRIKAERASTVNELKAWLADNQTIFAYIPNTEPVFEPLPTADQIALHQLETFDTVTYISTDSAIEPVIEVEYGTSKVGAYAIKGMNDVEADKILSKINISDTALNRQTLGYTKKNLLKLKSMSGTTSGANYVVNVDTGVATLNNTATLTEAVYLKVTDKIYLKAGKYILKGCPTGGQGTDGTHYMMSLNLEYADGSTLNNYVDFGNGTSVFTITKDMVDSGVYGSIMIYVFERCTANNLTFYPMIRSADIIDDTFEPYVDDVDTRLKALTPVNNFLATVPGSPLDAAMGKMLNDMIVALEERIKRKMITVPTPILEEDGYTRTYEIDLSSYTEVEVALFIKGYGEVTSYRCFVPVGNNYTAFNDEYTDDNSYVWASSVRVYNNKIVVKTLSNSTNPSTNYIVISSIYAR